MTHVQTFPSPAELGGQGFGSMRLRAPERAGDADPADVVIRAVIDRGIRLIDTADAYGNEELVGAAVRGRRDDVVLSSKFGLVWDGGVGRDFTVRADAAYVRSAADASLRRLGTDVIDLYSLHHRSDVVPIEETIGAMAGLVDAGKVRWLGLSNVSAEDLRRAHAIHPLAAWQDQWSLSARDIEGELLPTAVELGVTVVAHSPAAHGRLHGDVGGTLAEATGRIAAAHGVTSGQVAIAWVHAQNARRGARILPLPGTTSMVHAIANIQAMRIPLSDQDLADLDAASTRVAD